MDEVSIDDFFERGFVRELNKLRIDGKFTDFAICVEGELIKVHKIVLAANSDYFKAMLTSESSEEIKNGQVTFEDVDAVAVKLLVEFWYTGKMEVTSENICSLLLATSRFQSKAALDMCMEFAQANLTAANCLSVAIISDRCNLTELEEKALPLCLQYFGEIIKDTELLNVDEAFLSKLISDDRLNISNEIDVFELIIRWIEFDEQLRSSSLNKLMSQVRYAFIDAADLFKPSITNFSAKYREPYERAKSILLLKDNSDLLQQHVGEIKSNRRKPLLTENRRLYVFGGYSKRRAEGYVNLTEVYDPCIDRWSDLIYTKAQIGANLAVAISKNCIYALSDTLSTTDLWTQYYRLDKNEWSFGEPLFDPSSIHPTNLVVLDGCIYTFGEDDGWPFCATMKYDLKKNTSTKCAPTLELHTSFVASGQYIYAIGSTRDTKSAMRSVERYDSRSDKWESLASLQRGRRDFGSCVCRGKIYVAGGQYRGGHISAAEVYDPELNTWTEIEPMPYARCCFSMVELMGRVYAVGGRGDDPVSEVVAYDPDLNRWVQKRKMHEKRYRHCALVL